MDSYMEVFKFGKGDLLRVRDLGLLFQVPLRAAVEKIRFSGEGVFKDVDVI
jgi:hypothetical protein